MAEIAGRLGRPATSLSRPLDRLIGMAARSGAEAVRALFVPDLEDARLREVAGVVIVTAADPS